MTEPAKHSVSVAGVIVDDQGRCLLIQRADNGDWEVPGGILEIGESIPDGLRREVREETGLNIEPLALTGVYQNLTLGVVALVFRCQMISNGTLQENSEVANFQWASVDEIEKLVKPVHLVRITDSVGPTNRSPVRLHDGKTIAQSI